MGGAPASLHESRGFYTSHGPCMVHAWTICRTCTHPRTCRRDNAQQLPCSAATFRTTTTFAVLTVLAVTHMLHAQMHAEHIPPSLAAQHILNSSGGTHETRRSSGIHLCHQCHIPLPTQTPSPFVPAHSSDHARHADQPMPANACSSMTPHLSPPPTCLSHLATLRTAAFALSVPHSMHPTTSPGCTTYPRPHNDTPDPHQRPSTTPHATGPTQTRVWPHPCDSPAPSLCVTAPYRCVMTPFDGF